MNIGEPIPASKIIHVIELALFVLVYVLNFKRSLFSVYVILLFYFDFVGQFSVKRVVGKFVLLFIFYNHPSRNTILWMDFLWNLRRPRRMSTINEINQRIERLRL